MKNIIGCMCVIILSFFAIRPLMVNGYFPMHDDTQVARVVVMGKALRQGQFPVRWVSDLGYGYGYPIFNFYSPLPYYIGGGLFALGVDSVLSTKIMFAIGIVLAPITLYFLVSSLFGVLAAITSSMLFLYAPYHAVEIYIRGSVGEYWAIAFVPLLLYGLKVCVEKKHAAKGIVIGSLALGAIITSHTILGFLTSVLLGVSLLLYWTIQLFLKKLDFSLIIRPVFLIVLGLGISSFFWLPALMEMSATSVSTMVENAPTNFYDHFICVDQLWNSPWGYGGSAPGCVDGMSFKLGKVQTLVLIISVVFLLLLQKSNGMKKKNEFMLASICGGIVCTLCTLQLSIPLWKYIPFTSFIQYPWRLLAFTMMFVSICGGYVVSIWRIPIVRIGFMVGIVALTIIVNVKIFTPQYIYSRDSYAFETPEELRFTRSKISDEYLPPGIVKPTIASDSVKTTFVGNSIFFVRSLKEQDTSLYAEIETEVAQTITIRKAWFLGWEIILNGKKIDPIIEKGVPTVNLPIGKSIIRMQFTDTPIRRIGNIFSMFAVIIIGAIYIYGKKTNA